jgi:hypothetical protein
VLVLVLLALSSTTRAEDSAPLVLDYEVVHRAHDFVVRNAAYEMTFVNAPQAQASDTAFPKGRSVKGVVIVDSPIAGGGDAGQGFVTVTILPVPEDIPFDGEKGGDGTRDAVLKALGHIDKIETTSVTYGGLKGRMFLARGTLDATRWKVRMFVAWDAPRRNLIAIFAIFTPAASSNAPAALDAFLKAFKAKPARAR